MIFSNFFLLIFLHLSFFSIMIYIEILSRTQLVRVTTFYENSPKPIDVLPKDGESAETGRRVESFSHSARQADTEALPSLLFHTHRYRSFHRIHWTFSIKASLGFSLSPLTPYCPKSAQVIPPSRMPRLRTLALCICHILLCRIALCEPVFSLSLE